MDDHNTPTCPFCPFADPDASFVAEHIEFCHPENGVASTIKDSHPLESTGRSPSPFPVNEESTDQYVDCPHGCGETVTTAELSTHLDLHVAEGIALDESGTGPTSFHADLAPIEQYLSSDQEDSLDLSGSRKGGKKGADRDFARATSSSKPGHVRSPPGTVGLDGAKRLGVLLLSFDSLMNMN